MATYTTVEGAKVGILMGSASDWPTMKRASEMLDSFDIAHECNALSAHRNAEILQKYLIDAEKRGIELFICAAGGAAHLAGVVAAHSELPVLGCPMQAWSLDGLDSLLSTVQMPKGMPVATFAIGGAGATNAALFAVQMLSMGDSALSERFSAFRKEQSEKVVQLG
ncbi:MAG: 5-(carboxyamino)imidazole ribonucleotide mutase [Phycisphaerae bacterium]|nr:5-(carboxyamino)imidazole ribonucleotide mutase [Phycisphaerae bacterium]|tara:strand:- start:4358 stop:4855 length:498 start_codon:yes stop_codon:yes gene_type:complete